MAWRFSFVRHGVPGLAAAMLAFAIWSVIRADAPRPRVDPPIMPPQNVFPRAVAGIGIVEPNSEMISVGTELGGVVITVFVRTGDIVTKSQPLFAIDDRAHRAALEEAQAAIEAGRAAIAGIERRIELQHSLIGQAEAAVASAAAERDRAASDWTRYQKLRAAAVASQQRLETASAGNRQASAGLDGAQAALVSARLTLAVLSASLQEAKAKLAQAEAAGLRATINLGRATVRAPIAGEILRVNLRVGEYAQPGALAEPLVAMGAMDPLHLRVEIDETDIPRVRPGAPAVAELRGDPSIRAPLTFVRAEPQIMPKRSLNNAAGERVDMRVEQLIFRFDRAPLPLHPGQAVDVFIEARPPKSP